MLGQVIADSDRLGQALVPHLFHLLPLLLVLLLRIAEEGRMDQVSERFFVNDPPHSTARLGTTHKST